MQGPGQGITSNKNSLLGKIANSRGLKIASLNINSLLAHIDELRAYMTSGPIDILAINKTKLDQSVLDSQDSNPNYNLERYDRNRNGGGVALYITNVINYERMDDIDWDLLE